MGKVSFTRYTWISFYFWIFVFRLDQKLSRDSNSDNDDEEEDDEEDDNHENEKTSSLFLHRDRFYLLLFFIK
jgi:hypothetical protein